MNFDLPPDWPKQVSGPAGSAIALYWLKGSGWHKLIGFLIGCVTSFLGAPHLSAFSGMDEGLAGGLLGMFGFSLIAKVFKTIEEIDLWPILRAWIKQKLRVR